MSFETINSDVIVVREGLKRYPFFVAMGKNQLQLKKRFSEKPDPDFSSGSRPNKKKLLMKNCLECLEKIVGREDKKFCSDGCRNSYNNKINKDSNNFMRNVNNKLRKNYRILSELNVEGKSKTSRAKLSSKGFDFEFFTNILNTKTRNTYYYVYDQGFMYLENDYVLLVRKNFDN